MLSMEFSPINWLAVLVAVVVAFIIGGLWYAVLFARPWIRLHGYSDDQVKAMSKGQGLAFGIILAADLVGAIVLSILALNLGLTTMLQGLGLGVLLWIGFVAVDEAKQNAAHRKPLAAYAIDASYALVALGVMGAIIAGWR